MNTTSTPVLATPPPLVRVAGSHREMGRQIGAACANQVQHAIANAKALVLGTYDELQLTWEGAMIQSRKYLPFAQERYPRYLDELVGIAEGACVSLDDVMAVNAMEAVTMDALHLTKCTSLAVNDLRTADGHVLVAHNEDWLPDDLQDVYVIHATPDDEPPFLAMTYGALLPNIGFNAAGIAQCCDSVHPKDSRIGIPRVVVSRAVLGAETPEAALRAMVVAQRAAGYNHLLAHASGELYNVEVSARRFAIQYGGALGFLAHTNHYLDYDMRAVEDQPGVDMGTQVRYFRAQRLLEQTPRHTVQSLQAIQRDHINFPNSICNHSIEHWDPFERKQTINALVIDLTDQVMHLSWGNPCQNPYHTYRL